jgi:hypothetical protein
MITRTFGLTKIQVNKPCPSGIKELLHYASSAYSFVLPYNGEWTFKQWADEIRKNYDDQEIHNSLIISALERYSD